MSKMNEMDRYHLKIAKTKKTFDITKFYLISQFQNSPYNALDADLGFPRVFLEAATRGAL